MLQLFYSAAEPLTPAVEQSASTSPSLFITIVASAFGGALLTSGVTIWAKFADSKSEHRKWLREEKLKAYAEFSYTTYGFLAQISPSMVISDHTGGMYASLGKLRLLTHEDISERAKLILNRLFALAKLRKAKDASYIEERRNVQELLATLHTDLKNALAKKDKSQRAKKPKT